MNGSQLKKWREKMGWTQGEAAAQLGYKLRQYQYWERDEKPVPVSVDYAAKYLAEHPPKR